MSQWNSLLAHLSPQIFSKTFNFLLVIISVCSSAPFSNRFVKINFKGCAGQYIALAQNIKTSYHFQYQMIWCDQPKEKVQIQSLRGEGKSRAIYMLEISQLKFADGEALVGVQCNVGHTALILSWDIWTNQNKWKVIFASGWYICAD